MRAVTQAEIICDQAKRFAKSVAQKAQQEREMDMKDVALRLAHGKILELEAKLAAMSALAHEDPLTGILNRRGCDTALARELSRSQRHQTSVCVAMLDLDNFKHINDAHGHATGDAALVHFTRIVRAALRTADIFARTGGEEFLLILPDTTVEQAELAIARLQKTLAATSLKIGPASLSLTFSAGIAQCQAGDTQERVIDRADFGVMAAKRSGKNCIVCNA